MKKNYRIAALLLSLTLLTLSGCIESGGANTDRLDPASNVEEVAVIVDEYLSEHSYNISFIEAAAKKCAKLGDLDAAEKYMRDACGSTGAKARDCADYLSLLAQRGKLDFLRESFPAEEDILFKGKPVSEYGIEELYELAGLEYRVGYHQETCVYEYTYFSDSGNNGDNEAALPFGLEWSMDVSGMYKALGFSEELSDMMKKFYYLSIDVSGDEFVIDAKDSQYTAFSQHPAEEWVFVIRNGRTELEISNWGGGLSSYKVSIYF